MAMPALLERYVCRVLPAVQRELAEWQRRAAAIPHPRLREQALASIAGKAFHCQGGAVFAASSLAPPSLLRFIVALQTISDYLDNLCDRAGVQDPRAFRQLHQAMLDAVDPAFAAGADYYRFYPWRDDGGYLAALVARCRGSVADLAYYAQVQAAVVRLVRLYIDLQVYKHDDPLQRVPQLQAWFTRCWPGTPYLQWQEFAAACGSTLAIFALCEAAGRAGAASERDELLALYFPWICGLHIMLDYLIDLEEDRQGGDLNFVSFYSSLAEAEGRMHHFLAAARRGIAGWPAPALHAAVLYGLPAMYLSDRKVRRQGQTATARRLVAAGGWTGTGLHALCVLWRQFHPAEAQSLSN